MTLIQKICALGFETMGTAFCSAAVSYQLSQNNQKDLFKDNPWGRVNDNDEEGGNAWWKAKNLKQLTSTKSAS